MENRIKCWLAVLLTCWAIALPARSDGKAPKIKNGTLVFAEPRREKGQTDVLQLRCDPIPTVRVAFVGLGMRGSMAVERYTHLEGVQVVALCDIRPWTVERAQRILAGAGLPEAAAYTGEQDWKKVCERDDVDLIYNCTPWELHTPIAVYAMERGKHVALEVPAAMTIDECWQLVDAAERTRRHCMMLENCCYDFFEMATLNMASRGLFGEVMHVEGAYIHDLRSLNLDTADRTGYQGMWRLDYNTRHTGNPYPTHGLGPVCQILGIHRGDRMERLVSLSTAQRGLTLAAREKFGPDSQWAQRDYRLGDMNTTLIRTARGKTILIQHDVTSPRPYNRLHTISGTKGFAQKYPVETIALDPNAHAPLPERQRDSLLSVYEHPITREIGEKARQVGGHGGMDFIMDYRLIYCLRNGLPLDMDVYDAAEWSSLVELTEASAEHGGMPVLVPDFTRGAWDKVKGFSHAVK